MLADEMISHKIDEVALRILSREHNATPEEVKKPSRNRACSRWRKQARRRAIRRQAPLHAADLLQGPEISCAQGGQGSVHPRLRTRGARDEPASRNREGPRGDQAETREDRRLARVQQAQPPTEKEQPTRREANVFRPKTTQQIRRFRSRGPSSGT